MSKEQTNLMEGLLNEILRVTEIIKVYKELPKGAGILAASLMDVSIFMAKQAIKDNDVIEMLRAYEDLKSYEL